MNWALELGQEQAMGCVAPADAMQIEYNVLTRVTPGEDWRFVEVPEGVKRVASRAMMDCGQLEGVFMPDSVQTIGQSAFAGCGQLRAVRLPEGLRAIEPGTFEGCRALQEIHLPSAILRIGVGAFMDCAGLRHVEIPSNVERLESRTFARCHALRSIALPERLRSVGKSAFSRCERLESIALPQSSVESLFPFAFAGCESLRALQIPAAVRVIPHHLCMDCHSVERVTLPDGIEAVGEYAFQNCNRLAALELPNSARVIGEGAFAGCKTLERLSLPLALQRIERSAFAHCEALGRVALPGGLEEIRQRAFAGCYALCDVSMPTTQVAISYDAFENCAALRDDSRAAIEAHTIDDRAINIGSGQSGLAGLLSNLTPRTFVFDGVQCGSIEGVLQSFKCGTAEDQRAICTLSGLEARRTGRQWDWRPEQVLYWRGRPHWREGDDYQALLDQLYACVYEHDPSFAEALLATVPYPLIHEMGKADLRETVLTEAEFCGRLMALRERAMHEREAHANTRTKPDRKKLRRLRRAHFGRHNLGFTPLEEWERACLTTVENLLWELESGYIDWDCGNGYYATTNMKSCLHVKMDPELIREVLDNGLFKLAVWYNK